MARRPIALLLALGVVGAAVVVVGSRRVRHKVGHILDVVSERASAETAHTHAGPRGTLDVRARAVGPHPRFFLTQERMAKIAALGDTPARQALFKDCDGFRKEEISSGYQGWGWGDATVELALCARLSHDASFAASGVHYFKAMLDDRFKVGDGQGGDSVVRHDDGYPMRSFGWLGAIAYDWLHDAPGMTPDLRKKAVDRYVAYVDWFKKKGWQNQEPIANYYAGYFGTVAFAGLACEGDDPRADALREQTQRMWNDEIVPTYRTKLEGGDFPEGWQYGDYVGAVFALYVDAETTSHPAAGGSSRKALLDDLPWLRATVRLHAFELEPDGKHTYDGSDWTKHPPTGFAHTLYALTLALPDADPVEHQAAFLARLAQYEQDDWSWLRILADDPTRPVEDPRRPPASYFSPGTASVFGRSSFAPSSLWFSLTSEPTLADHEHLDAGHFEIIRGSDPLLIDSGDYGSPGSLSHNVVIVDDPLQSSDYKVSQAHHDIITYKANQSPTSDTAHIARYEDGGGYAYALADYASAFNPRDWPQDKARAVTRAEREFLFSRAPVSTAGSAENGRVVVYDRFTLIDPRFTTTFILHGGLAPQVNGPLARFSNGGSSAWVTTLLPAGATSSLFDESHNKESDERPWFTNKPPDGVTSIRYQVASPVSPPSTERRFLHAIVVGSQNGGLPNAGAPARIDGDQVDGAVIEGEAYVFDRRGPQEHGSPIAYSAPQSATHHIVCDLAPSTSYAVTATTDGNACKVALTPGSGKTATAGGVLAFDVGGCSVR